MDNHRLILTGVNGFIGSNIFRHFRPLVASIDILTRDLPLAGQISTLKSKYLEPPSKFTLIHCASATPVNSSQDKIFKDNINFAMELCTANLQENIFSNIINLSSMSVYGDHSRLIVEECTLPSSLSIYGASKLSVEQILSSHCDILRVSSTHLRLPGVVGPKSYERSRNLISTIKHNCSIGLPLVLSNPDSHFNNIVHVSTLLTVIEILCKSFFAGSRIVNLASLEPLRLSDIVSIIAHNLDSIVPITWVPPTRVPFTISTGHAVELGLPLLSTREAIDRFCIDPP
jgi:nucleoside-diphosphate-sugar epimerase